MRKRWLVAAMLGLLSVSTAIGPRQEDEGFADLLPEDARFKPPFDSGEELRYEIYWKPVFFVPSLKAGEVRLRLEHSNLDGVDTFKIRGWATSDGALTNLTGLKVENYYESEIDRSNFRSYRILQKFRQGKRQRDLLLVFDYSKKQTRVKETDVTFDPPRVLRSIPKPGIPAPAVDVLSVFYVARLQKMKPGDRFIFYLNEKGSFRKVRVVAEGTEIVETPVGKFPSVKLSTTGGLFRQGGDLRIWYSNDNLRIPTKFEADLKLGKVYGQLIRVATPRLTRSIIRVK